MIIETRVFGAVEIDDAKLVRFVGPMLGFEGAERYALMDPNPEGPFKALQLVDDPDRCFLVADPSLFFPDYHVQLDAAQVSDLGLDDPAEAAVLVVVTARDGGARLTANLLGPLVVNAQTFRGKQVVLTGTSYKVDEPLPVQVTLQHG
ncbi:MAG: flagellar assembly protein FliW [Deltaproteobacteria bacterium]|nr:flagellar assembly protein FliW [Deltaproteobacteria bacterium]